VGGGGGGGEGRGTLKKKKESVEFFLNEVVWGGGGGGGGVGGREGNYETEMIAVHKHVSVFTSINRTLLMRIKKGGKSKIP